MSGMSADSKAALELGKIFVRTVVRMFYETEHIVVVDALVYHGALTVPDIAIILDVGKQYKGVQKFLGKLREGGLISVHGRPEMREGAMKVTTREYFYIDYRRAIDATKFKIHMLDEKIKQNTKPSQEKAEFVCPQCKSQWTQMDVLDRMDPRGRRSGFLCLTCDHPLDSISDGPEEPENDDTPAKFNRQFGPILKLMQQIDQLQVPAIEGDDAIRDAIELPRDQTLNPTAKHEAVPTNAIRPTAVKGLAVGPEKIEVSIASNTEYNEAARAAEAERQAKIAQQNMMPEWHTKSTITGATYTSNASNPHAGTNGNGASGLKTEEVETKPGTGSELDAVFAQLEEQRRKEQQEAEEEEEDEEDEDEDEFEDVAIEGTPNGIPEAKRIKLESSVAPSPSASGATPASNGTPAGAEESDEDEFEDVPV